MSRKTLCALFFYGVLGLLRPCVGDAESARSLHHDLKIVLHPPESRLSGFDTIAVDAGNVSNLTLLLSPTATVHSVTVSGKTRAFTFKSGHLLVAVESNDRNGLLLVQINYSASFEDHIPAAPANTDNPGYGVTGIISERGTFLQAGAGWYPEISGSRPTFHLFVEAPAGTLAVTSGRCLGHETKDGWTTSEWEAGFPSEGLSLFAGPYTVQEKKTGGVTVATYFLPESASLSLDYLRGAAKYIALYEELLGAYPFRQFSIVENFFPTGYGFPSYTLLGSTVLRLPFIIETSLGHEIAHSWWGNGVLVDYSQGNWCEGLTTYLSDYLYQERASEEAGRHYRLQILRNFTTLVNPGNDFPLSQFQSRNDSASQAIGYGKAAMVFHMVRRSIGDRAFWDGLRDVFRDKLFKEASWKDFQIAFEGRAGVSLECFFAQWIFRKGAPSLRLQDPAMKKDGMSWAITGSIVQKEPPYALDLTVRFSAPSWMRDNKVLARGRVTGFQIPSQAKPSRVAVDPECDVMRILYPSEIPPSVNSLKGSPSVLLILPKTSSSQSKDAARILVESMGFRKFKIITEGELKETDFRDHDVLLVGLYETVSPPFRMPEGLIIQDRRFTVNGKTYDRPSDTFFGVFRSSAYEERVVALFLPLSEKQAGEVAGKITHYGSYSYLVFREGRNEAKGTWPVSESPLVYEWEKE